MQTIQLKLSLDEVNLILSALGERSFQEVHGLISTIHEQAQSQVSGSGDADTADAEDAGEPE